MRQLIRASYPSSLRSRQVEPLVSQDSILGHPLPERIHLSESNLRDYEALAQPGVDAFERWALERDRGYDNSPSARYVSRDVIGYQDLDDNGTWRRCGEAHAGEPHAKQRAAPLVEESIDALAAPDRDGLGDIGGGIARADERVGAETAQRLRRRAAPARQRSHPAWRAFGRAPTTDRQGRPSSVHRCRSSAPHADPTVTILRRWIDLRPGCSSSTTTRRFACSAG